MEVNSTLDNGRQVSRGANGMADYRYVIPHHKGWVATRGKSRYWSIGEEMEVRKFPNMGKKDPKNGGGLWSRRLMAAR